MADSGKSIYGRKIFFINPTPNFEQMVLERLRLMEYEVYVINDYRKVKPILRKYADSICLFLVENQLSLKGWKNLITSMKEETVLSNLDFGVIMHKLQDAKQANFEAGLNSTMGIFDQNQDIEQLFHEIVRAIDSKEAKGLRKYVRANCLNENADLLWLNNNKMFKLKIIDISSVGIAAKLSNGQANSIFINQVIEDVTLNLRNMQVSVDIQISAIKSAGDFLLVVIMFNSSTLPESINKIRGYIAETLQEIIRTSVRAGDLDRCDYEK